MKIMIQAAIEEGDDFNSICEQLSADFGDGFNANLIWDWNRNQMPGPSMLPRPGSILRIPLDPTFFSGGPKYEELRSRTLSEAEIESSSTVLGGLQTPATPGGEPGAVTARTETPAPAGGAPAPAAPQGDDGFQST